MRTLKKEEIREAVRENYGKVALAAGAGCGCAPRGPARCCAPGPAPSALEAAAALGYSAEDVSAAPKESNLGLGCGNPHAIAGLKAGETVLDLGSGAGFDCFLAARAVGESGRVIGVDMTPEMVAKARANARQVKAANVEFRLGEIEALPVADASVDAILSNCVINLSPEKDRVFREAFRVLRKGGRLAVSDIVAVAELPPALREDVGLLTGCVAGASSVDEVRRLLAEAGFEDVRVTPSAESRELVGAWLPGRKIGDYVASATIEAVKP